MSTRAPVTRPFRSDGNGCPRRRRSRVVASERPRVAALTGDPPVGSDVDELVEVRDEVLDEPLAGVAGPRPKARRERVEADRRDDLVAGRVLAERCRGPAA